MKRLGLLLALLLGSATALHAQPDHATKIYNENAAADARRLQKLKDEGRTPNTPSSGGMQAPVDGSFLLGEKYRRSVQAAEEDKQRRATQAAKEAAEETAKQEQWRQDGERYLAAEAAKTAQSERQHQNFRNLLPTITTLGREGIAYGDLVRLAQLTDRPDAVPGTRQQLADARQARQTLAVQLAQPGGNFAALRELVGREWWVGPGEKLFGCYTALRDYKVLQGQFPDQAAVLSADLVKLSIAMLVSDFSDIGPSLDESLRQKPYTDGMKELSKQFAANPAPVFQSIEASLGSVSDKILSKYRKYGIPKDEKEAFRLGTQMLYTIYKAQLQQHPDDSDLQSYVVASAEKLLYLMPNAPAATQAEWVMQRFEKRQDASQLREHVVENSVFLAGLTDEQARRVCPALGIELGDRQRLARMLVDSLIIPDNPDWKALKAEQPLTKFIKEVAKNHTSHRAHLILGTLEACTGASSEKFSQTEAREHWEQAQGDWRKADVIGYNADELSPLPMVGATAGRNIYRAVLLGQAGDYKEGITKSFIHSKAQAAMALDSWRCDGNQGKYERALVLLDQSPSFPPIGVQQKKEAVRLLTSAASEGYAPAHAKLKEL